MPCSMLDLCSWLTLAVHIIWEAYAEYAHCVLQAPVAVSNLIGCPGNGKVCNVGDLLQTGIHAAGCKSSTRCCFWWVCCEADVGLM